MMKILNYAVSVLFTTFIVVQFNDPDPWLWVFLYGTPVAIALFAARHHVNRVVIWAALATCLAVMAFVAPGVLEFFSSGVSMGQAMSDQRPYVEQMREFFGLAIVVAYYLGLLIWAPRKLLVTASDTDQASSVDEIQSQC